eukprot:4156155-Prymnesium_polylepis.1
MRVRSHQRAASDGRRAWVECQKGGGAGPGRRTPPGEAERRAGSRIARPAAVRSGSGSGAGCA